MCRKNLVTAVVSVRPIQPRILCIVGQYLYKQYERGRRSGFSLVAASAGNIVNMFVTRRHRCRRQHHEY